MRNWLVASWLGLLLEIDIGCVLSCDDSCGTCLSHSCNSSPSLADDAPENNTQESGNDSRHVNNNSAMTFTVTRRVALGVVSALVLEVGVAVVAALLT